MANTIKAMYPITLQNDGKNDQERNVVNVNQERLNENFRNIATELIKLWESGDYTLNILSARISRDEEVFVTVPDAEGIAAQAIATSSVILMMPESILQQVAETVHKREHDPGRDSRDSLHALELGESRSGQRWRRDERRRHYREL